MKRYMALVSEMEISGKVEKGKGFKKLEDALNYLQDEIEKYTTDKEQFEYTLSELQNGKVVEFECDDNEFRQVQIVKLEIED